MTTRRLAFLISSIVAVSSVIAMPGLSKDDLVVIRQADMKAMADAAKTISGMFSDPATYSSVKFRQAADAIASRSGNVLIDHFLKETADPKAKAKPEIGKEGDRFDRLANDLGDYARALGSAAESNPGPMTPGMRMQPGEPMGGGPLGTHVRNEAGLSSIPAEHVFHLMLQTCTTCHARFRMD